MIPQVKAGDLKKIQPTPDLRVLWENVRIEKAAFDADRTKIEDLDAAVNEFFTWEKKFLRRDFIRKAEIPEVQQLKLSLIRELRNKGVFVLERGALDDYYPAGVAGQDKPSKALAFIKAVDTRDKILPLSRQQTCPTTGTVASEFEFICSSIFC